MEGWGCLPPFGSDRKSIQNRKFECSDFGVSMPFLPHPICRRPSTWRRVLRTILPRLFAGFDPGPMRGSPEGPKIMPPIERVREAKGDAGFGIQVLEGRASPHFGLSALLLAQEMGGEALPNSGFKIQDKGFKIQDSRFRIQDSGFWI